ncbi:hypothetical protein J7E49_03270 [Variovorax paradoxus]|nr:hypothetical protein [Variovorax paradoxus]
MHYFTNCAHALAMATKNPSGISALMGLMWGEHADGLETRMKPVTSLAEQAGFEPAEGY